MLERIRSKLREIFATMLFLSIGLFSLVPASGVEAAELIMLEEDGCPWCELWREEVGVIYSKTKEGKLAPLRIIDIHDPLPDDLAFLVKGGYTPTFVLIEDGKEFGRIRGYPGESFFWGLLSAIIERLQKTDKST